MIQKTVDYLFQLLLCGIIFISSGSCTVCDSFHISNAVANSCYKLKTEFEEVLLYDEGNKLRLKNAFFYSPTANPVLLKVVYNVSYSGNMSTMGNDTTMTEFCDNKLGNDSAIDLNQTIIIRGWTSSGVYTLFHPGVLNWMQLQLPFSLLRLIHRASEDTTNGPEADTFLWDGSYDLPTLYLDLYFTSLPCIPSQELFNSTLEDINSMVYISNRMFYVNMNILFYTCSLSSMQYRMD